MDYYAEAKRQARVIGHKMTSGEIPVVYVLCSECTSGMLEYAHPNDYLCAWHRILLDMGLDNPLQPV